MTTEHLKTAVEAGIGPLKAELRWQRWILFALGAVVFGPHLPAGPVIAAAAADPAGLAHVVVATRAALHL